MPAGELVHTWITGIGDWHFGLAEFYWPPSPYREAAHSSTIIFVGPTKFLVSYSAYEVIAFLIAISALSVFIVALTGARFFRARDGTP